jgi:hypothetical protein
MEQGEVVIDATVTEEKKNGEPEVIAIANRFFDNFMHTSSSGQMETNSPQTTEDYKRTFAETANNCFKKAITYHAFPEGEDNPLLNELVSLLASLDHNKDIYYSELDVPALFQTIASTYFGGDQLQARLLAIPQGDTTKIVQVLDAQEKQFASIKDKKSTCLRRRDETQWEIVDASSLIDHNEASNVIEMTRQDNPDKHGWNKYRFREGNTLPWEQEPNYWSSVLRDMIADTARETQDQIPVDTDIVFVTEGGIYKGTSTANTDLDTSCYIFCDSPDDFEASFQAVNKVSTEAIGNLPFQVKGSAIGYTFYSRSTNTFYWRSLDTEEYREDDTVINDDRIPYFIKRNEQGILLTKNERQILYQKPEQGNQKMMFIVIDPHDLQVTILQKPLTRKESTVVDSGSDWM